MSPWGWVVVCLGARPVLGLPLDPRGAPLDQVLEVEPAGDVCLNPPAVRARVHRWLKPTVSVPSGIRVLVKVETESVSFLVMRGSASVAERHFDELPRTCQDRLDAVSIAVALALEQTAGDAAEGAVEPSPEQPGQPPEPLEPSAAKPSPTVETHASSVPSAAPSSASGSPAATASRASGPQPRLFAGALVMVVAEVAPAPVVVAGIGPELHFGQMRFAMRAFASSQFERSLAGGQVRGRLLGGQAHSCLGRAAGELGFEACVGGAGGAIVASGAGYPVHRQVAVGWAAGLLRLGTEWPVHGPVAVRLAAQGFLNLVRPEVRVHSSPDVAAVAEPWAAAGALELLARLP